MTLRVEVAVPAPLHHTFTYLWPAGAPPARPGMRVRVPFGRRHLTGVVMAVGGDGGLEARRLRPVEAVLDAEPVLGGDLLDLAKFVIGYYAAPPGDVLRVLLPAGIGFSRRAGPARPPTRRLLRLSLPGGGVEEARRWLARAPAQARALEFILQRRGRVQLAELLAAGIRPTAAFALASRGLASIEEEPDPPKPPDVLDTMGQTDPLTLMPEQFRAVEEICQAVRERLAASFLLHGVTGSGKTEVYLRAAEAAVSLGRGALILVPEIGLTPALAARLSRRFGERLALLHSGLPARDRRAHWHRIRSGEAVVVVGARSAVFAPLPDPGIIVVDEEQDTSYKQEETPRYNARDLALVRGRSCLCPVVLVTATPSMESYARATSGRDRLLVLSRRVEERPLPGFEIVDLRHEFRDTGRVDLLSRRLLEALESTRAAGGQAMLLLNRRGWAAFLLCRACGDPICCGSCSVSLTLHRAAGRLRCHYCGHARTVPTVCPACGEDALQEMGAGTERMEDELARVVPGLRLLRMDADSVRPAGGHARLLARFAAGEADVLLGTQMIAKGHDFPGVTLVGILGGDAILGLPEFRAAEWTFHLVTQAAGRAGRGLDPGRVILQAFRADHYALEHARRHDFEGFYEREARFRRALLYPPYTVLAAIRARHKDPERAASRIRRIAGTLREDPDAGRHLFVLGPAPAPLARLRGRFRFHLLIKSRSRRRLTAVLGRLTRVLEQERVPATEVVVDVDPVSLM